MKNLMLHLARSPLLFALTAIFVPLGLVPSVAWGQALPPTGSVGRELNPSEPVREVNPISAPAPSSAVSAHSAVSVFVNAFKFTGNVGVSTEELQAVVAPHINQKLDLNGLDKVADKISRHYREKGFTVARAYLPPQQSADGVITLAVIEGQYGAVNIRNNSTISDDRLRQIAANNLCEIKDNKDCVGKLVHDAGLERGIFLIKDLPGVTATAGLKPGQAVGTSDLDIIVNPVKHRSYSLGFDNFGSLATGTTRLNSNVDLNNLGLDGGDQLSLGIATTTTTHTTTGSVSYSVPVGYRGLRAGAAFSRNQYRLGAGFSATNSYGTSNAWSAFSSYPVYRGVNDSFYLRGALESRSGTNVVGAVASSYRSNAKVVRLGVMGDHVDSFHGGGYTAYGLTYSHGNIDTTDVGAVNLLSAGRFSKMAYSLARQQAIDGPLTLYSSLSGQIAGKNLDGSEQTGLGGPGSARAYGGEAGGSTGAGANVELRYTVPTSVGDAVANITYAFFMDRGWVKFYQTIPTGTVGANSRSLSSYGIAVTMQSQGKVPSATSTGYYLRALLGFHGMRTDQQSTVDPNSKRKFWLQGGYSF